MDHTEVVEVNSAHTLQRAATQSNKPSILYTVKHQFHFMYFVFVSTTLCLYLHVSVVFCSFLLTHLFQPSNIIVTSL